MRRSSHTIFKNIMILGATMSLSACNGMFEGIYDDPIESEMEIKESSFSQINTTEYTNWVYIDLSERKATTVEIGEEHKSEIPAEWDLAIHRYDIIKADFFMHAQRQRSILYLVSERKFPLIAVSVINGTLTDRLDLTDALLFGKHRLQQLPDLVFLYLQAFFIWHGNIAASAADIKMRATAVFNTDSFYR